MRQQVCGSLKSTVGTWQWNLQSKYGDPRVYAMQQAEQQRRDAAVAFDLSRRNAHLLEDAYARQERKHKDEHTKRLTARGQSASKRPQFEERLPKTRKQKPSDAPPPAPE